VSKYSLSAASLITAIPAGYLAYVLVMIYLQDPGFNNLAGFFQIITGLTLTLVTLMVLMPVGILIFGKKSEKTEKPKEEADDGEDLATDEDDLGDEDEGEDMFADEDDEFGGDEDLGDEGFDDEFGDDAFDDFEDDDQLK